MYMHNKCSFYFYISVRAESWYARLVPVLLPLAQVGLTGSIYLTLAISVERYTTVVHPFFRLARAWTARHYVLPTTVFALAYNIPKVGKVQSGGSLPISAQLGLSGLTAFLAAFEYSNSHICQSLCVI